MELQNGEAFSRVAQSLSSVEIQCAVALKGPWDAFGCLRQVLHAALAARWGARRPSRQGRRMGCPHVARGGL